MMNSVGVKDCNKVVIIFVLLARMRQDEEFGFNFSQSAAVGRGRVKI